MAQMTGVSHRGVRVYDQVHLPRSRLGLGPREVLNLLAVGSGHEAALVRIGAVDLASLRRVGFDQQEARVWREFFAEVDRASTSLGNPSPSARGRAELFGWLESEL